MLFISSKPEASDGVGDADETADEEVDSANGSEAIDDEADEVVDGAATTNKAPWFAAEDEPVDVDKDDPVTVDTDEPMIVYKDDVGEVDDVGLPSSRVIVIASLVVTVVGAAAAAPTSAAFSKGKADTETSSVITIDCIR